ncbi:gas vesicle protein [Pectobacteriaceae bacterium CE70]|uniref:Gas vesicle protein n=1 Tax=Serratia sp. (strain ATCC 39006) TaxID=104623 RepID=M9WPW4_SERS3|nr:MULTISPECIES: gas vesicle protein [Enterobacterales]WJV62761.1 gas vesicle protein [Pectobacteriaceae bacterium C52]WJV67095.1 gas vesicle protein [Pectobacteriaceae bacterium CE70]WJY11079.1 gas vesicle protein [Pectobacteriaceae bacterium C80]AGJ98311.1 GvpA3 [Serratia sp. ATCC 39006]AUG98565.1 gas vesicle protein [Serratia sp. ATCC 39006]
MSGNKKLTHSTDSTTVADLLERLLDKGVVISGDIRIRLVEVELLTLEIRLLICSVDKAVEMGLDWWSGNPAFDSRARVSSSAPAPELEERLQRLEARLEAAPSVIEETHL